MLAPESKLPIFRTVARVYRFIAAHPADLVRIGWLPLLLLLGAIGGIMLVAWHRLVMRAYALAAAAAPQSFPLETPVPA